MVFVLIALWTIAAILLIINPKNESTRWAAFTAFAGGGGGLSRAVTETILPYLEQYQISTPSLEAFLLKMHMFGSFMNHNGLPYCFLMFAISYSGLFRRKKKMILAGVLPIPIIGMLFLTSFTPPIQNNFQALFFLVRTLSDRWSYPVNIQFYEREESETEKEPFIFQHRCVSANSVSNCCELYIKGVF